MKKVCRNTRETEELEVEQKIAEKITRYFIRAGEEKRKDIALRRLMNIVMDFL